MSKNYVKKYKGYDVPEGATHYGQVNLFYPQNFFYRSDGGEVFADGEWKKTISNRDDLILLPEESIKEWNGEGLPPVGTVCEIAESTEWLKISHTEGMEVEIYTHFTTDRGVDLASFVSVNGKEGGVATCDCFRPLKSQEQKDREAFIDKCEEVLKAAFVEGLHNVRGDSVIDICNVLFDADFKAPEGE